MKKLITILLAVIMAASAAVFPSAALGTTDTYTIVTNTTATLISWDADDNGLIDIPLQIDGYDIIGVNNACFLGNTASSVNIPTGITLLGVDAFCGMTHLTEVSLPRSVTSIGDTCFCQCYNLESITIPNSVTKMGDDVFDMCDDITIYCYADTEAEEYAKEYRTPYVLLDENCAHTSTATELLRKPTCEGNGLVGTYCTECGKLLSTEETSPTNHTFTAWDVVGGIERHRECSVCGRAEYQYSYDFNWSNNFSDVNTDAWYTNGIAFANYNSILNGVSENEFGTETYMTRYMFVTMLGKIAAIDSDAYTDCRFDDVRSGQWYSSYVEWAASCGIVSGITETLFGGGSNITREQMAVMLYNYASIKGFDIEGSTGNEYTEFTDSSDVSEYARAKISWAVQAGIISGTGNGMLSPRAFTRRCETAVLIRAFISKYMPYETLDGNYEYLVFLGVDGMGNYNTMTDTPNFDRIFGENSFTNHADSEYITSSAEAWGAIFHGVTGFRHGYVYETISNAFPENSPYPSFLKLMKNEYPDSDVISLNTSMIEDNSGIQRVRVGGDAGIVPYVSNYIEENNCAPKVLSAVFNDPDGAGHASWWGSDEHLGEISECDRYIGEIYDMYEELGIIDKTLFIVTTDHGGIGRDHGGRNEKETNVFLGIARSGYTGEEFPACNNRDVSAIVLDAFLITRPSEYVSRVPKGLYLG